MCNKKLCIYGPDHASPLDPQRIGRLSCRTGIGSDEEVQSRLWYTTYSPRGERGWWPLVVNKLVCEWLQSTGCQNRDKCKQLFWTVIRLTRIQRSYFELLEANMAVEEFILMAFGLLIYYDPPLTCGNWCNIGPVAYDSHQRQVLDGAHLLLPTGVPVAKARALSISTVAAGRLKLFHSLLHSCLPPFPRLSPLPVT